MTVQDPAPGYYRAGPGTLPVRFLLGQRPAPDTLQYHDFTIPIDWTNPGATTRTCTCAEWEAWMRDTGARNMLQEQVKAPAPTPAPAPTIAATDDPRPPSVDVWHRMDTLPDHGDVLIAFRPPHREPFVDAVTMIGHAQWAGNSVPLEIAYAWRHSPAPPPMWEDDAPNRDR